MIDTSSHRTSASLLPSPRRPAPPLRGGDMEIIANYRCVGYSKGAELQAKSDKERTRPKEEAGRGGGGGGIGQEWQVPKTWWLGFASEG
ncbi:hypothetical protein ACOMHN_019746 [Nucella lapillus]